MDFFGTKTDHQYLRKRKARFWKIPTKLAPHRLFTSLANRYEQAYLLESATGPRNLAEFSFIGFGPVAMIAYRNGKARISGEIAGLDKENIQGPLETVRNSLQSFGKVESTNRFMGGAVGYISYDCIRNWENIQKNLNNSSGFPDVEFGIYEDGVVYDHRLGEAYYFHFGKDRHREVEESVAGIGSDVGEEFLEYSDFRPNVSRKAFKEMVMTAKSYITAGDIFQVVLSKQYQFRLHGSLLSFYRNLRRINPSPYMYYLKMGKRTIVGSSPEMLVRVVGRRLTTFPIAGTKPIGQTPQENKRLVREMLSDPKERAEHVMLVDLARNDLGRVSRFGSVRVQEFMKVRRFSHVQHIVSKVVGTLHVGMDAFDAVQAVFPAGTMSGAPKVRAMEIIEELEPCRRGPYAGALGYFSFNGNADFALTIRTLIANGEKATIQSGAGIVADSVPDKEWRESNHKAMALIAALDQAGVNSK